MNELITQHPIFKTQPEPGIVHRPIELILADHYRHRLVAQQLVELSEQLDRPDVFENARLIRHYLQTDLFQHEVFEEEDFVPLLKRRCLPGDNIDNLLAILIWDHFVDKDNADLVNAALGQLAKGCRPRDLARFRASVRRFSSNLSAHIIWENRALLPLARKRLTPFDLVELGESATDRRRKRLWPQMYSALPEKLFGAGARH